MAHEFTTLNGKNYIVCQGCRMPVGTSPYTNEWAAYDAPAIRVDDGTPEGVLVPRSEVSMCLECYSVEFLKRYPGAEVPDTLWDGRVPGAKPVDKVT